MKNISVSGLFTNAHIYTLDCSDNSGDADVGLVMIGVKLVVSDAGCGDSDVSSEILVVLFVEVKLFMGLVMII